MKRSHLVLDVEEEDVEVLSQSEPNSSDLQLVAVKQPQKKKKKQTNLLSMFSKRAESNEGSQQSSDSSQQSLIPEELGVHRPYNPNTHYKFISWNVNGLSAIVRKTPNYFKKLVEQEAPTCILLQETKLSEDVKLSEMSKYHLHEYTSHFNTSQAKKGYSGTAVYTLKRGPKIIRVKFGIGNSKHDREGRCITVEYENFFLVK